MCNRLLSAFILCLLYASAGIADEFDDALAQFKAASGTDRYFTEAYGYALFPTIAKGGAGIGAAYGTGRVYRGGTWVGKSSVVQLSIGFQLGGQAFRQIIFFRNQGAYDRFTSGSFEFGVDASAVLVTLGAQAKAGTTGASASGNESRTQGGSAAGEWGADMAVFTLAKGGLMYEASIGGQKFNYKPRAAEDAPVS